jgi:hypothetical protein
MTFLDIVLLPLPLYFLQYRQKLNTKLSLLFTWRTGTSPLRGSESAAPVKWPPCPTSFYIYSLAWPGQSPLLSSSFSTPHGLGLTRLLLSQWRKRYVATFKPFLGFASQYVVGWGLMLGFFNLIRVFVPRCFIGSWCSSWWSNVFEWLPYLVSWVSFF